MGKFSELDYERQVVEFFRARPRLPAPFDQIPIIGKLVSAPDNRANRATAHRRQCLATAERHEREAIAAQERIERTLKAGRAS